jgi:hypothetical protein
VSKQASSFFFFGFSGNGYLPRISISLRIHRSDFLLFRAPAFMTRCSDDMPVDNPNLSFKDMPMDSRQVHCANDQCVGPKNDEVLELAGERVACSLRSSLLGSFLNPAISKQPFFKTCNWSLRRVVTKTME